MVALQKTMQAWVIRPDRLGDPRDAMHLETIDVPEPGPGEVLVSVMAAGVNYNGVWAAAGLPVSIFRYTGYDFHIAGSDASGVVEAVGPGVTRWKPGDEVVIHCNQSCGECPECNGLDPMACTQQKIWAYETNWGSFAEYCKVQAQQLLPKPPALTLGGGRKLRPDLLHRLPDAGRPGADASRATTCSSGAPAAVSAASRCSSARSTAPTRSPSSRRTTRSSSAASWAPSR